MAFLNPIFLIGALAAAVPVLVHLVRRTRAVRIAFPSLMFLRRIDQKTIRKRTLRNLALLLLRCCALLLLALAFARPYFTFNNPVIASTGNKSQVILIDTSYSMRYGEVFAAAKKAAADVISDAAPGDQLAVVAFSQRCDVLAPLKADKAEALTALDRLGPGLGSTDYLQAIQAADALLKDSRSAERKIFLISDFQETGWNHGAPPVRLSEGVKLVPTDVSDANTKNVVVSQVKADPLIYTAKYPGKVIARIENFGADLPETATVELKLNDLTVERRPLKLGLSAGQVDFSGFNVPEGSNRATVEVSGDGFQLDNRFFFTIKRDDQTRVLSIETPARGRSESFFVQQSLEAGENNQFGLTIKTPGTANPTELTSYRAVIINDAGTISDGLAASIKSFVEGGGGLIIATGRHTEPGDFNRLFGSISPAELGESVQGQGRHALMSQIKTDHPIFSAFARSGRLASTRVYGYHRLNPSERASTIAALDDGNPIFVEGSAGRGRVLLIATSLDTAWSDLPLTPLFLPFVRQMLEYLIGDRAPSTCMVGQAFTAPPDLDGSLPAIDNPGGGRVEDLGQSPTGLSVNADEIGFYKLRYRDRIEQVPVNLDTKESDPTKLNVDDLLASVTPDSNDQRSQAVPSERLTAEEIEARQRTWLFLLLASLAFFVSEALLARRIRIPRLVR